MANLIYNMKPKTGKIKKRIKNKNQYCSEEMIG